MPPAGTLWDKVFKRSKEEYKPDEETAKAAAANRPMRNHGLMSKAERTLDIAGWSAEAMGDVEIFRLVDTEGLTPLLTVINKASLAQKEAASQTGAVTSAGHGGSLNEQPKAITSQKPDEA